MADLVPSTRLIARTDDSRQSTKYPIAVKTKSITVADTTNTKTVSFSINGRPTKLITAAPNVPTDSAYSITFKDEDGNTLYTDASRADNANAVTDLSGTANRRRIYSPYYEHVDFLMTTHARLLSNLGRARLWSKKDQTRESCCLVELYNYLSLAR